MDWLTDPNNVRIIAALGSAALIAWALTPLARSLALWRGLVDVPDDARRVHDVATPRIGGAAMLIALLIASALYVNWGPYRGLAELQTEQLAVMLGGAALICCVGLVDDIRGIGWRVKLLAQSGVALGVVLMPYPLMDKPSLRGLLLVVNFLDLPFLKPVQLPVIISIALVVLWIVAAMNMLNFIDGVDGLAGGQAAIIAGTFAVIAASYGRINIAVVAAATSGAAVGFLRHNYLRRGRATIFMGDSGSMLLGFMLATIAVQGVLKTTAAISLVIPMALLAVPMLDTTFVVLKRLKYGQSIASADRWHLHHRLLNAGYGPRRVTAMLLMWTAAMSGVALALRFVDYGNSKHWNTSGVLIMLAVAAIAIIVSVYLVVSLEIIKLRHVRERNRRIAEERRLADRRDTDGGIAGPEGVDRRVSGERRRQIDGDA